jgi:RimJ/RimL family protein N-acetyltransferase
MKWAVFTQLPFGCGSLGRPIRVAHGSLYVPENDEIINFRGRRVCLRPLTAKDRPLMEELIRRTEVYDLRMRFFGGSRSLPPDVFDQLMLIDPSRRVVLVARSTASDGKPEILAVARAHLLPEGSAELALLVRSDLKGMGMGSVLLDRLIARCRHCGISLLVAEVLTENTRMLRLADKYGFRPEDSQFGTARLVLDLDPLAAQRQATVGRRTELPDRFERPRGDARSALRAHRRRHSTCA